MITTALALASLTAPFQHPPSPGGTCRVTGRAIHGTPGPSVDGPLQIQATFDANVTQAQRNVIFQAIADWTALVVDVGHADNPYPIHFENDSLPGDTLAAADTNWLFNTGHLLGSTITIDDDGSSVFYVDPTPGSSTEFDANGQCTSPACQDTDLLTVMRHEIGHALGWLGAYNNTNPLTTPYITGFTYDAPRLNIPMDQEPSNHASSTVFPGELMNALLSSGERRWIRYYPSAAFIARNIDHELTLKFVDGAPAFPGNGTADSPWNSMAQVAQFAPPGSPLLLIPGTIGPSGSHVITHAHELYFARGGGVLIE